MEKIVGTMYSKNKLGIGYSGGPACYFVKSDFGEMEYIDQLLFGAMIEVFNEKLQDIEYQKLVKERQPEFAKLLNIK